MDSTEALREAVEVAFENYRQGLSKLIVQTLTAVAAKDPKATYEYNAGMGIWYFKRTGPVTEDGETFEHEDDDIRPEPAFSAIEAAGQDYEYQAIPQGEFQIKGNKILVNNLG